MRRAASGRLSFSGRWASAATRPPGAGIADFISLTTSSGNTFVAVNRDGTGGADSAQDVAKIEGVTGLALTGLLVNANLVVPV